MITTFITVLAVLCLVGQVGLLALLFWQFANLTPLQQMRAKISVSPGFLILFGLSAAWLISLAFV